MVETFVLLYIVACILASFNPRVIDFLLFVTTTRNTPYNRVGMIWFVWLFGVFVTFLLGVFGLLIGRVIQFWMNYF